MIGAKRRGHKGETMVHVSRGLGFVLLALATTAAQARITRIEITKTEPAFAGETFGEVGSYERLVGRVTGELDPADPANAIIQDLNLAPRDTRGMVEYSTNIELLKPADMACFMSRPRWKCGRGGSRSA
jgi:hypothetical protein